MRIYTYIYHSGIDMHLFIYIYTTYIYIYIYIYITYRRLCHVHTHVNIIYIHRSDHTDLLLGQKRSDLGKFNSIRLIVASGQQCSNNEAYR